MHFIYQPDLSTGAGQMTDEYMTKYHVGIAIFFLDEINIPIEFIRN